MTMQRSFQRSTSWVFLIALIATQVTYAQQPSVQYRLEQVSVPEGWYVNDFNNQGFVVGHSRFTDGETVVLYDHFGVLGTAGKTWSLDELVTLPAEYVGTSILDINNRGQFVVALRPAVGPRESILVDLMDSNGDVLVDAEGNPAPTWKYLNIPESSGSSYASQVNDFGQVMGHFSDDSSGDIYAFTLDSTLPAATPVIVTDPNTGQPIPISNGDQEFLRLNNLGQVAGNTRTGAVSGAYYVAQGFRVTPGVEMLRTPFDTTIRTMQFFDMNDLGQLAGSAQLAVTSSGRKGKTTYSWGGVRYDEFLGYDPGLLATTNAYCIKINNSSDVLGYINTFDGTRKSQFLVHNSVLMYLDDLVTGDVEDVAFWQGATHFNHQNMNDRDASGFPEIFTRAQIGTTTGKGKKQVTTIENRFYMLTPVLR